MQLILKSIVKVIRQNKPVTLSWNKTLRIRSYILSNGYCSGTHGKDSSTTKMYNINKQPENGVKAYYVHTYTYKSQCRVKSFHSKHHRAPNTSDTYTQDALNFPFGQRTETKFICKHKNKLPLKCRKKMVKSSLLLSLRLFYSVLFCD